MVHLLTRFRRVKNLKAQADCEDYLELCVHMAVQIFSQICFIFKSQRRFATSKGASAIL